MRVRHTYPAQALSFMVAVVVAIVAPAHAAKVQAHLSITSGKTEFRSGEPIFLDLAFTSDAPGPEVNASNSRWPFSVDRVVLDHMQGVFPLYDDYVRGHPFGSDAVMVEVLQPNKTVAARLALTDIYRFDQAGTYQVHVVTRRTGTELTTNDLAFSVRPFGEDEESELARSLEKRIRDATDMADARALTEQLDVLPGAAATQAKISLYLHPKVFEPFDVDVEPGLWIARDRQLVPEGLRSAFHAGLASASGRDVGTYAYLLAQTGTEDDRRFITLQLKEFQMHLSVSENKGDSVPEIDLIEAVNHGRSWDGTREEQIAFERSCVTAGCKQHFAADLASNLEP